jgi:CRP-like cAMP-binding protein
MGKDDDMVLPSVRLEYEAGELIVKEGDYGISIYHVTKGKVEIFVKSDGKETSINTLGPGEIIGEMIFLTGNRTRRSASVRAIERSVIEAWHPSRISAEYEAIPFMVKYIVNQTVSHLTRLDKMISDISKKRAEKEIKKIAEKTISTAKNNRSARKEILMDCRYRPVDSPDTVRMWGRVINICKGGVRLDVRKMNSLSYPHDAGTEFFAVIYLPKKEKVEVCMKVINSRILKDNKTLSMGVQFLNLDRGAEINLGFLLMGK